MTSLPRSLSARARRAWRSLEVPTPDVAFDPAWISDLPEAARRWLTHCLTRGAPLRHSVRLRMHGEIKLGGWMPFTADQILSREGFVWAATAGGAPMRIRGFDRFSEGTGEMRWSVFFGLIPVMTATGPDVTRSAAGRHAGECVTLVPGSAVDSGLRWQAIDVRTATAECVRHGFRHRITLEVDARGALQRVTFPRWGNPDRGPFQEHVFGVSIEGERRFGDVLLPSAFRAGWWPDDARWAEGEFFRATIDDAQFF